MSLFVPYRRATLLIPSGPAHDPDRKHLFIVLTDPARVLEYTEKQSLLVGVTTVQPELPHDPTCLLHAGDHEFIRHRSFVHYARALIQPSHSILNEVKKGLLVPKDMLVEEIYPEQSLYFLYNNKTELHWNYLLGILNSKLITSYYRAKAVTNRNSIAQLKKVDLDQFPIRTIRIGDREDNAACKELVQLVDRMLSLHKQIVVAKAPHDKKAIEREIDAADGKIDQLIYELYALTKGEINIVEGGED